MKFNWGTGIFTFIGIFILLCVVVIVFTVNQGVNLVHKDYYDKGVDHTEEMKVRERSLAFSNDFELINLDNYFVVDISENLSGKIDSGNMLMFRPSDNKKDVEILFGKHPDKITFSKADLISGRYILKINWFSEGKKYELNRPVNVQ